MSMLPILHHAAHAAYSAHSAHVIQFQEAVLFYYQSDNPIDLIITLSFSESLSNISSNIL
jgi:hypothetical protein